MFLKSLFQRIVCFKTAFVSSILSKIKIYIHRINWISLVFWKFYGQGKFHPVLGSQTENIVDHSYVSNTLQTQTLGYLGIEVQLQR